MSGNRGEARVSRKRSARLSEEGLALLQACLLDRWSRGSRTGKLTREAKAQALGVSVVTADRILRGESVDRATLIYAFSELGLKWEDRFASSDDPEVESPTFGPSKVVSHPMQAWGGVILILVMFAIPVFLGLMRDRESPAWLGRFDWALKHGTQAYQSADYAKAERLIDEALELARLAHSPGHLASALRMKADLANAKGEAELATRAYEETLTLRTVFDQKVSEAAVREAYASVLITGKRYYEARRQLELARRRFQEFNDSSGIGLTWRTQAELYLEMGLDQEAEQAIVNARKAISGLDQDALQSNLRIQEAAVAKLRKNYGKTRRLLSAELQYWTKNKHPRWIAAIRVRIGELDLLEGFPERAKGQFQTSLLLYRSLGDSRGAQRALKGIQNSAKLDPPQSSNHPQPDQSFR